MAKVFNVTADCKPEEHYMVKLDRRLSEIKRLVDAGKYFTINRARQYGKTTTLRALSRYLQMEYYVAAIDFQFFGSAKFQSENSFSLAFAGSFLRALKRNLSDPDSKLAEAMAGLEVHTEKKEAGFELKELFEELNGICRAADRPVVLMIDEVDSAADNQVFLDFLSQLRAGYIDRDMEPTFRSVILAGVYDIKNLKQKFGPAGEHKVNSPWNIAADFNVDMSFSAEEIAEMLREYELDHHTGMALDEMAGMIYSYTSGYPFLVSKLCKIMDEYTGTATDHGRLNTSWTLDGFHEAVRILLSAKNTLFESLIGKLTSYPKLDSMLRSMLFTGKSIVYNPDEESIDMAVMFGFVKNQNGNVVISNRLFETRLYNYYLSAADLQNQDIYKASLRDRNQ